MIFQFLAPLSPRYLKQIFILPYESQRVCLRRSSQGLGSTSNIEFQFFSDTVDSVSEENIFGANQFLALALQAPHFTILNSQFRDWNKVNGSCTVEQILEENIFWSKPHFSVRHCKRIVLLFSTQGSDIGTKSMDHGVPAQRSILQKPHLIYWVSN